MDSNHLSRYFPVSMEQDEEILAAQVMIRESTYYLACEINKFLPEGQAKNEMLMRLMHLAKDVELALSLDGVSRVQSPIVTTRQ